MNCPRLRESVSERELVLRERRKRVLRNASGAGYGAEVCGNWEVYKQTQVLCGNDDLLKKNRKGNRDLCCAENGLLLIFNCFILFYFLIFFVNIKVLEFKIIATWQMIRDYIYRVSCF